MNRLRHTLILLAAPLLGGYTAHAVLPMREQWRQSCRTLQSGDPGKAVLLFREFEHWYGAEATANEPNFRERRRRLHGLACLQAGLTSEGVGLLETWLEETGKTAPFRAYIRFQLGIAHLAIGQIEQATGHWATFLKEHEGLPECILVHWMWSDLEINSGNPGQALDHMQKILDTTRLNPTTASLVRAAMALVHLCNGSADTAVGLLEDGAGDCSTFRLWRSLLAAPLAQGLIKADQGQRAARAARWFEPPGETSSKLNQLVRDFRSGVPATTGRLSPRESVWQQHWKRQLDKLDTIRDQLDSEQSLELLYMLKLEALLKADQSAEAAVLAHALLTSCGQFSAQLVANAYKAAIRAHQQLADWDRARSLALAFLEHFPEDEALPEILLLNARTAAGTRDYAAALKQVASLMEAYPSHPSQNSWCMLQAEWLLLSGQPDPALNALTELESVSPQAWIPFIDFQKGRCLEALKRYDVAVRTFHSVASSTVSSPTLAEFASTSMLKIHLKRLDSPSFFTCLDSHRRSFPQGGNALLVENLAGSFHLATGNIQLAEECFMLVARENHPCATFAHGHLSDMYRNRNDIPALLAHASDWIRQCRAAGQDIPDTPLEDFLIGQKKSGQPAIPFPLLESLLEDIESGGGTVPIGPLLSLVSSGWDSFRMQLSGASSNPRQWIEASAADYFSNGNLAAFSAYMMFLANVLEQEGRTDSADAKRIQVLHAVNPDLVGEPVLLEIARTADRYNFPETLVLLETFLKRFPDSPSRPEGLYLLGLHLQQRNEPGRALQPFREILSDWPDSLRCVPAGIALAAHLVETSVYGEARTVALGLMDRQDIRPPDAAALLLILAESGFAQELNENATLACMRIINLYPDFHDEWKSARNLLLLHKYQIKDPSHLEFIESLEKADDPLA